MKQIKKLFRGKVGKQTKEIVFCLLAGVGFIIIFYMAVLLMSAEYIKLNY